MDFRPAKLARSAVAAAMSLWLSGAILVFCCPNLRAQPAMPDHCPLAKVSNHCDKAGATSDNQASFVAGEAPCVDCCTFIPVLFDKSRKVEPAQKQVAAPAPAVVEKIVFAAAPLAVRRPTSYQARLTDRQQTYIQNRVLRI